MASLRLGSHRGRWTRPRCPAVDLHGSHRRKNKTSLRGCSNAQGARSFIHARSGFLAPRCSQPGSVRTGTAGDWLMSPEAIVAGRYDCRETFAKTLEALAEKDARIVAVVNDSVGSSKLVGFQKRF